MSDRLGPMAFESHQHVFLGEDLMNAQRDYSDDTARVIDEEIELLLRGQEERATQPAHAPTAAASTWWPRRSSRRRRSTAPRSGRLVQQGLAETQQAAGRRHRGLS